MSNEFTCANCGNTYEKGLSDEEASAQLKEEFGEEYEKEDWDILCEDCYQKFINWSKENL